MLEIILTRNFVHNDTINNRLIGNNSYKRRLDYIVFFNMYFVVTELLLL